MELIVKKATNHQLVLIYKRGYNRAWVVSIVSFFIAGLIYWFVFTPFNPDAWTHQGPLLKKEKGIYGVEVLFRMPNHQEQHIFYVPLDEPFIRKDDDRKRYELFLIGQTSEKRKIDRIYKQRLNTYPTLEEARKYYNEIVVFLKDDQMTELLALSEPFSKTTSFGYQLLSIVPFILATCVSIYFLFFPIVKAEFSMHRPSGTIILKRSSLLLPKIQRFSLKDFLKADLIKEEDGTNELFKILIYTKNHEPALWCQYRPPYRDDKHIASLSQYAHMINWWNDDELIEKYGDKFLQEE